MGRRTGIAAVMFKSKEEALKAKEENNNLRVLEGKTKRTQLYCETDLFMRQKCNLRDYQEPQEPQEQES
jgi:hypothetical protein